MAEVQCTSWAASLKEAMRTDLRVNVGLHSVAQDACRAVCRALFRVNINELRTYHGLPHYDKKNTDYEHKIVSLLAKRPLTREVVAEWFFGFASKTDSTDGGLSALAQAKATGMTRFMMLSRQAMKYGNNRLQPSGLVAELQNDYVTRKNVCAFTDKAFYQSREWRELRLAVLAANPKCVVCGAGPDEAPLQVDHIRPRSLWPELSLEPSNMQTLCKPCNLAKSNVLSEKFA